MMDLDVAWYCLIMYYVVSSSDRIIVIEGLIARCYLFVTLNEHDVTTDNKLLQLYSHAGLI
jgi:hypothetical protein